MVLIMVELNFLCEKKILARLKQKITFALTCFVMKLVDFSHLRFRSKIGKLDRFLLVTDDDKSHYVYIKDLDRFMFHKSKTKKQKILLQKLFMMF